MDVPKLIAALQPYADTVDGEPRIVVAETLRRCYWIVGVRPGPDGDPVVELVFDDPRGEA